MSLLTLHEFMNLFPIQKVFDGAKYEMKDYYSTLEAISELGLEPHEKIGENILKLMMEYMNRDIMDFAVQSMVAMSAMRRFDGHLDLMEEFMATQGMDTENTFRNSKGDVMYVRHGKTVKLKLNKKQHLHIVKYIMRASTIYSVGAFVLLLCCQIKRLKQISLNLLTHSCTHARRFY